VTIEYNNGLGVIIDAPKDAGEGWTPFTVLGERLLSMKVDIVCVTNSFLIKLEWSCVGGSPQLGHKQDFLSSFAGLGVWLLSHPVVLGGITSCYLLLALDWGVW